ncbi:unnamed protein product [Menidia menidia]|uniref:(Atlantic silverside) hypothetical protein n=1 Tax=Menidia menidia TaxID=238744 RepID=A0A8S4B1J8_9TELE|nr:unnamed protein product [Menidia menidia]
MKAQWWSCVLGLLCMPAEVMLDNWAASQHPSTTSHVRVNSSLEITCSTSLSKPIGLTLHRLFKNNQNIVYLHFKNEKNPKITTSKIYNDRVTVLKAEDSLVSVQLSWLQLDDTDLYYCRWTFLNTPTLVKLESNGTVIIVRESGPKDQCRDLTLDLTLICLSVTALTVTAFLFIGALILKCNKFKEHFKPARALTPPRPERPQLLCGCQQPQYRPYLMT